MPRPALNYLLIASEAEARAGAEEVPVDGISACVIEPVPVEEEIAEIYSLLTGEPSGDRILNSCEIVFMWDELHGPWLTRVADEFVAELARIDPPSIKELAALWGDKSEWFKSHQLPKEWCETILSRLVTFASASRSQGKHLYWQAPTC